MILDDFLSLFSVDMGIDLGTANTLVCVRGEGIVLDEPSVVAVRKGTNQVIKSGSAVGDEAKKMLGKTPHSVAAIRPLKDGVISDFEITEAMLSYFIRKVVGNRMFVRPRVVIAVPSGITAVERRAVYDSAERAGARRVFLIEEPMAAGLGADLPIAEATASMIVDIGGGTSEVAIMSLGDISVSECVRVAGDDMDEAIMNHMKETYGLMIGEQTAERIKLEIGTALMEEADEGQQMVVRGQNIKSHLPGEVKITSDEICEALQVPVDAIIRTVAACLEKAEPELAADLVENGIVLAGGGALLRNLDKVIGQATGLPTRVADEPLTCVARGTGIYLEQFETYKEFMYSDADE